MVFYPEIAQQMPPINIPVTIANLTPTFGRFFQIIAYKIMLKKVGMVQRGEVDLGGGLFSLMKERAVMTNYSRLHISYFAFF